MKSPSRLPAHVEGATSQSREELHGLIEPPTRSDESREAVEYVNNVVLPMAKRRMDMAERRYFNEVGKERSRRTMIYSHDWGVNAGHEHTDLVCLDAALLAANCDVPLMRSIHEPDLEPVFGSDRISFNGRGDSCDDFQYPPHLAANREVGLFGRIHCKCRTECRDYDTLVSAVLLSVKHHIGDRGLRTIHSPPRQRRLAGRLQALLPHLPRTGNPLAQQLAQAGPDCADVTHDAPTESLIWMEKHSRGVRVDSRS